VPDRPAADPANRQLLAAGRPAAGRPAADRPRDRLLPDRRIGSRELVRLLDGWRTDRLGQPDYLALAGRLRTLVLDGRLALHTGLPSERTLADLLGTSRTTTTSAYRQLREQGFAAGRQGSGTWTTLPRGEQPPWPAPVTGAGIADLATAAPEGPPELYAALAAALDDLPRLLPGHGYLPAGQPELRAAIAARYTARGLPTSADEVLVTAGASQALRLVLAALAASGDRILVEDPTWPVALDAARALGLRPVGLPVESGWDAAALRALLRRTRARIGYLMPDAQNPTGLMLVEPERSTVVAALADAGCLAVVDETCAELDLRGEWHGIASSAVAPSAVAPSAVAPSAVAPFGAAGRPGTVVHVGSASKVFWGGLRVGWIRAERSLIGRLTAARVAEDLGGPPVEQLATAHLFDRLPTLLPRRRAELAARCRALQAALARELPGWAAPDPDAGLALWCQLPGPIGARVAAAARRSGLALPAGSRFGVEGGFPARIRLTFGAGPQQLDDAVHRLAGALGGMATGDLEADPLDAPVI
jgi:DNA-binding transcriptional MocR family regulator